MKNLCPNSLACIASVFRRICLVLVIFLLAMPALAEDDTVKYHALEADLLYSIPFNQAGVAVRYVGNEIADLPLNHVFVLGMRYQKLNPYERSNREYRAGWDMRYNAPERTAFGRQWQVYIGAGPYLKILEDIETPEPLFDDKVWRWGLGAGISAGLQVRLNEGWLTGLSVTADGGFMTHYPKDYAPFDAPSRPYTYFALIPRVGVVYQIRP